MQEQSSFLAAPDRRKASAASVYVAPLALLAVAAAVFFVPLLATRGVPGDLGDARFNMYVLEHIYRWLIGLDRSLLSPPMFFPYPDTLGFSDTHFGSAIVYALLRVAGLDNLTAFTAWIDIGYVLTFLAAYYVLLRLAVSPWLAAIGAFGFAFSLASIAQIGHAQLVYRVAAPFAFYFTYRYSQSGRPNELYGSIAAVSLQILINVYLGLFTLIIAAILFVVGLFAGDRKIALGAFLKPLLVRRNHRPIVVLVTLALAVSALAMLGFYGYVTKLYGITRDWAEIKPMVPRLWSYLMMDYLPYWAPISQALPDVPMRSEHEIFLGVPLTALLLVTILYVVAQFRSAAAELKVFTYTVVATFLLMTLFGHYTLYWFIGHTPGFTALRAVARYQLVAAFPIVAAVALFAGQFAMPRGWRAAAAGVVALWMAVDVAVIHKYVLFSSEQSRQRTDAILAQVDRKTLNGDSVLVYGVGDLSQFWWKQADDILAAQELGIATLNGYSGFAVPGFSYGSCIGFIRQLWFFDQWAKQRGMADLSSKRYRPVEVGLPNCDLSPAHVRTFSFTDGPAPSPDAAKLIALSDARATPKGDKAVVTVTLHNGSSETIHGLSPNPLQLSWRFPTAGESVHDGWDPRAEVGQDLAPGATAQISFLMDLRGHQAGAPLQVTFVIEGKLWAHDVSVMPVTVRWSGTAE